MAPENKDLEASIPLNVSPVPTCALLHSQSASLLVCRSCRPAKILVTALVHTAAADSQSMPRASDVDRDMTHGEHIEVK